MAQAEEDVLSFQTLTRGVAGICEGAADDEYVATVQKDGVTIRTTVVKVRSGSNVDPLGQAFRRATIDGVAE